VFNVGTGRSISIKQLFELLQHIIGTSVQPIHLPSREGDIRHSCADVSRIHDWLGWKYTWEIEQGLSRYVESMKMMAAGSVH
jgi:nucleoside-diphosphate-sugar epimerase